MPSGLIGWLVFFPVVAGNVAATIADLLLMDTLAPPQSAAEVAAWAAEPRFAQLLPICTMAAAVLAWGWLFGQHWAQLSASARFGDALVSLLTKVDPSRYRRTLVVARLGFQLRLRAPNDPAIPPEGVVWFETEARKIVQADRWGRIMLVIAGAVDIDPWRNKGEHHCGSRCRRR